MKKVIIIIISIIILGSIFMSDDKSTENAKNANTDVVSKIEIKEMSFEEENIELDLKETKSVVLNVTPQNAQIEELRFNSTNSEIATFEKDVGISNENTIFIKIQPVAEGECEVYATYNEIESNKIKVKIIDNERLEREKKEAEEQAKKEAEEKAKKEAEEQAKKQTQTTTTTQKNNSSSQTTSSQQSTSSSSSQSNSNNTHGKSVYRTPSGKRYHFDPDCGGKNAYQTTLDSAKSSGLTPCQKCAQ